MPDVSCVGEDHCEELGGTQDLGFASVYRGDPPSRRILSSKKLRLIADLSPLTIGHMLLVPQDHYLSIAQAVSEIGEELTRLLRALLPVYRDAFGEPLLMEHGSSSDELSSACISHAHMHLLPIDGERVRSLLERDGLTASILPDLADLHKFGSTSYFYCQYGSKIQVYIASGTVRGQYLRSIAGEALGIPDPFWDYSMLVRKECLRETISRCKDWSTLCGT